MIRTVALGWRAHVALTTSAGMARVVAPLSASLYAEAAGELIWIGPPGAPLHARAVVARELPTAHEGDGVRIVIDGVAPWRPSGPPLPPDRLRDGARALRATIGALGEPRGLGRLLVEDAHDDPVVARARPHARALAAAAAVGDAEALVDAARPLLGLGPGLTPSGDDYVGGVLFACRRLADDDSRWDGIAARIVADAAMLTHPISARLLADLAAGEGWAPLHDLVTALAEADESAALAAARRLTALGHTSGWDLLAGVVTGLDGSVGLSC